MEWILLTSQEEMLEYIEVHKDEPVTYFCTSFNTSRHLITDETELTYTIIDSDGYTVTTCKEWANNRVHELLESVISTQEFSWEYFCESYKEVLPKSDMTINMDSKPVCTSFIVTKDGTLQSCIPML